jgi:hypothetical protein
MTEEIGDDGEFEAVQDKDDARRPRSDVTRRQTSVAFPRQVVGNAGHARSGAGTSYFGPSAPFRPKRRRIGKNP